MLADAKDLPKVVAITPGMRKQWGTGTVVIPAPAEVDEIMKRVPKAKLITINHIRNILARRHGATIGCPITTGLFARIAAKTAEEDEAQGKKRITPYWRTLKVGGELNARYPGGIEGQKERLEEEGHKIISRGKRFFVRNYEHALVTF
jgi:alkylated DNA nucleotide flippase Atl1